MKEKDIYETQTQTLGPKKKTTPKPSTQTLPPWAVILVNDKVNFAEDVARKVHKLTRLSEMESLEKTIEAHHKGRAFLLSTHKEKAELLQEQFQSQIPAIRVDIEPAK